MQTIRAITSALVVLAVSLGAASAQVYQWTTIAGLAGSPGSADGTNSAARFCRPQGIASDYAGHVFVADTGNSTIRMLSPVGTNWVTTTIAGLAGNPGSADGTNSDARFAFCSSVAANFNYPRLFVADTLNHTIRLITPEGTNWLTTTIVGLAGNPGSADGTNGAARFAFPAGVAAGSELGQNVFVADTGNSTLRMITRSGTDGWFVTTLAGLPGSPGSGDGTNSTARFRWPYSVAVTTQTIPPLPPGFIDHVFVADTWNSTIRELDFEGPLTQYVVSVHTVAGTAGDVGSGDGTNGAATFDNPTGIAVLGLSPSPPVPPTFFVADWRNNTVRKITLPGFSWVEYPGESTNWVVSTIGGLADNAGYADGINRAARFSWPQGIAVDDRGNVFVADTLNHTIRMGVPVVMPPVFQSVTQTNGDLYFTWNAVSGCSYQVQYKTNLTLGHWSLLISDVRATGSTVTVSAALGPDPQRFYRVVLWP